MAIKRRTLWIAGVGLFALAVGSGYVPDLMLMREMAAARQEGLIQPDLPPKKVAASDDARAAYNRAFNLHRNGYGLLQSDPMKQRRNPTGDTRALCDAIAEASKRSIYSTPAMESDEDPRFRSYNSETLEIKLEQIATALAMSARSEEDLLAAARVANHLRIQVPTEIPSTAWGNLVGITIANVKRLGLDPAARARVIKAFGPRPEPVEILRARVVAVLQKLDREAKEGSSASRTRRQTRYIAFWRSFLKNAPSDPAALAKVVTDKEPEITYADNGVNVGYVVYYASSSPHPWKQWAYGLARALKLTSP